MELNININQKKLTEFCKNHNITITSYSPLGRPGSKATFGDEDIPNFLANPKVIEIAKKYNKTPAQISLRFIVRKFKIVFYISTIIYIYIYLLKINLFKKSNI